MKLIYLFILLFLVGCSTTPQAPRAVTQGDFKYKNRVVVNKQIPNEIKVKN